MLKNMFCCLCYESEPEEAETVPTKYSNNNSRREVHVIKINQAVSGRRPDTGAGEGEERLRAVPTEDKGTMTTSTADTAARSGASYTESSAVDEPEPGASHNWQVCFPAHLNI